MKKASMHGTLKVITCMKEFEITPDFGKTLNFTYKYHTFRGDQLDVETRLHPFVRYTTSLHRFTQFPS